MRNAWQSLRKSAWCRVATRLCYNLRLFSLPNSRLCKHGRRVSACSPLNYIILIFTIVSLADTEKTIYKLTFCCIVTRCELVDQLISQWVIPSYDRVKIKHYSEGHKIFSLFLYSKTETKPHTLHKSLVFIKSDPNPIVMSKILSSKCLYLMKN